MSGGEGGGDDTRVVTSEGGLPRGHEVFFDDGRVRGIFRRFSASMLTAGARDSPRLSNHPSNQRVWSPRMPCSLHPPRYFVDCIFTPPPPPLYLTGAMEVSDQRALTTEQTKTHPINYEYLTLLFALVFIVYISIVYVPVVIIISVVIIFIVFFTVIIVFVSVITVIAFNGVATEEGQNIRKNNVNHP